MRNKRKEYLHDELTITNDETNYAQKIMKNKSYQEQRAYFNRLKAKNPKDLSNNEMQALMVIASSGLDARGDLDKLIRDMTIEITQRDLGKERMFVLKEMINILKILRGDFSNQNKAQI